jgi:alpha-L-fucosidase
MLDPSGKPILWESCVTINTESWGYNKYETEFKTSRDLIRMLVEVVSKGGNLLLNVGPMPDGRIQPEFVTRLNAMGEWMRVNSESIYGTTASPFTRLPFFGRATTKGNILYLHVFEWPRDRRLRVPGLKNLVQSARLLADAKSNLRTARDGSDLIVELPAAGPDEVASVVALTLDGAPQVDPYLIRPDAKGVLQLGVESAEIETRFEQRAKKENALGHVFLTRWTRGDDVPTWRLAVPKAGRYKVEVSYGATRSSAGTDFVIGSGKSQIAGKTVNTDGEWAFRTFALGELGLEAGEQALQVKAATKGTHAMSLEWVKLTPVR